MLQGKENKTPLWGRFWGDGRLVKKKKGVWSFSLGGPQRKKTIKDRGSKRQRKKRLDRLKSWRERKISFIIG